MTPHFNPSQSLSMRNRSKSSSDQTARNGSTPPQDVSGKLIIVMVGLPARGKSCIVKKLARYLNWLQFATRIFNAGQRRRVAATAQDGPPSDVSSAAFFDPSNPDGVALRDQIALDTLDELLEWLTSEDEASVGIFDATNTTVERRRLVISHIRGRISPAPEILFLESYTFDRNILQNNVRLKLFGPDYRNQEQGPALADFIKRVANYERSYVPLGAFEEQQGLSYVSMIDVGRKIGTHLIHGFLSTQVVGYLLNFNLAERQIWLTCNGESVDDSVGRIGRNADLTDHGRAYATALEQFISSQREIREHARQKKNCTSQSEELHDMTFEGQQHHRVQHQEPDSNGNENGPIITTATDRTCAHPFNSLHIWTSTMPQCIQTGAPFSPTLYPKRHLKMLDDVNAGDMAGLTFPEIETLHPSIFSARRRNRLLYRWPGLGGEAYIDAINRMRSVTIELERVKHHVLLITHRAIVRVLLGYFLGIDSGGLADLRIPKDGVFCIEPKPYAIDSQVYTYVKESNSFVRVEGDITTIVG